jgi:alkylhydroperoxidase family enzyme
VGARESDQISAVPYIPFGDLPAPVAEVLRPRVERLGYLGEFFQATAHQPDLLLAFHSFTESGKASLGARLTEVVALTVATRVGNEYELHQHEQLSIRLDFGREWIAAVERLDPDASGELADDERAVQRLALALVEDGGRGSRQALDTVAKAYGPELAVAVLFVVGRYLVHGVIVNALELAPPVPSVFGDGVVS